MPPGRQLSWLLPLLIALPILFPHALRAQAQVFPGGGELCDFGFDATSGSSASADTAARQLRARGSGGDAASAEFGVNFIPSISFPAELTAGFVYNGRIEDFAAPTSTYRLEMFLFNEDTGAELDHVTVDSASAPFPQIAVIFNPFDEGTLTADLEAGTEYRVQIRLAVDSNGALASVDFFSGDRRVDVSCLAVNPNLDDSDGDSIYDSWEIGGIDVDGGGDDLDLQALGADFRGVPIQLDPQRKDILVEIDYFDCAAGGGDCPSGDGHSHRPDAGALTTIVDIFAAAPVSNPDGTNGINLWVVVDEDLPHQMNCDLDAACFDVIKAGNFGPSPHGSDDPAQAARMLVFHYNLWVHDKAAGNGSSGESDGGCDGGSVPMWGDDFVVSLGSFSGQTGTTAQQAGTFMHELGHNLGLCHGGGDDINCKPNYLSVMSYTYQLRGIPPASSLDYARAALPDAGELVETDLDETSGLQDGALQTWYGPPANINGIDENGDGDFTDDWNLGQGTGTVDWNANGAIEGSVAADINDLEISSCGTTPGETLRSLDDWSSLVYNFRDSAFYPSGHAPGVDQELDAEDAARIDAATWWRRAEAGRYEYRAKVVCGLQGDADVLRLVRGLYGSTINIANPGAEQAEFLKQLVLAFPPAEQRPGELFTMGLDSLPPQRALKVDCDDIRTRLFAAGGFPEGYIEGFVTLRSDRPLDVVAVYTAGSVDASGMLLPGSSIDVEPVAERVVTPVLPPDLVVEPALPDPPFDEEFQIQLPEGVPNALFCGPAGPGGGPARTVEATVRNLGVGAAGPSELVIVFQGASNVPVSAAAPVVALDAGQAVTVSVAIPRACYAAGSCEFELTADGGAAVAETDEGNNSAESLCLRPTG